MEGFGRDVQRLVDYFYADDGALVFTWVTRIQRYFDTLTDLFDHVGLRTNVTKMVIMPCQSCCALGSHLSEAYRL